jgi:hypothetical protein
VDGQRPALGGVSSCDAQFGYVLQRVGTRKGDTPVKGQGEDTFGQGQLFPAIQ